MILENIKKAGIALKEVKGYDSKNPLMTGKTKRYEDMIMGRLRNWMANVMRGRYGERGTDEFSRFLTVIAFVLIVASLLFRKVRIVYTVSYWLVLLLLIYSYVRIFSKNIAKRQRENDLYLKFRYNRSAFFAELKRDRQEKKTHKIFYCPGCRQKVRVPKGKGRISIRCPRCGNEFIKKS